MYWFTIAYYYSPKMYVMPVMDSDNAPLMVYASTPQQAGDVAREIIASDMTYSHARDQKLITCVAQRDQRKWQVDHM